MFSERKGAKGAWEVWPGVGAGPAMMLEYCTGVVDYVVSEVVVGVGHHWVSR